MLILLLLASSSCASMVYTLDLDRTGHAAATLSLQDEESVRLALPADAGTLRILGGSYSIANGTATIEVGQSGITTFSFTSDTLSSKSGSSWRLAFTAPEGADVSVFMPPYSAIEDISPGAKRVYSEDSRAQVDIEGATSVSIDYRLEEQPSLQGSAMDIYVLAGAIVIAAFVIGLSLRKERGPQRKASLSLTEGKKEMIGTFNENDKLIVDFLLENHGRAKRNALERKTGISKSSLAMALNRLEKRRIIEIDRGATTHYVKLSDYFLGL